MTPNEVIQRARTHFGEDTALTITDIEFQQWVNDALQETYDSLPPWELRQSISEDAVALSSGKGAIDDSWDRILEVKDGTSGVPLVRTNPQKIRGIDSGTYFVPTQDVWAVEDKTLLVRPTSTSSVNVVHQDPPPEYSVFTNEITEIHARWHQCLVWLVTSYAYSQEEDLGQAEHYRSRFASLIGQAWGTPVSGAEEEVAK